MSRQGLSVRGFVLFWGSVAGLLSLLGYRDVLGVFGGVFVVFFGLSGMFGFSMWRGVCVSGLGNSCPCGAGKGRRVFKPVKGIFVYAVGALGDVDE